MLKLLNKSKPFTHNIPSRRNDSIWSNVELAPPDTILAATKSFLEDGNPNKVNLSMDAYRGDNGKPFVLEAVREAEKVILNKKMDKEYLPITGDPIFVQAATTLAFGRSNRFESGENVSLQTVSGSGALFIIAKFIELQSSAKKVIYMPNPTWNNHKNIFNKAGITHLESYTYYDPKTNSFNFKGCLDDISKIPNGCVILLQACAHNPTGVDPNKEQWKEISSVIKKNNLLPFFDMAYQGFATGNLENDAFAPRLFLDDGHDLCLAQTFSKNMGLYGERVGTCTIFVSDPEERRKVLSQIKVLSRGVVSNCPLHGARIASAVMTDFHLQDTWLNEVRMMAHRATKMREILRHHLEKEAWTTNWTHVTNQIGMFCYSGLTPKQVKELANNFSIYLTEDGRLSVIGLTSNNVEYVANAINQVAK